MHCIHFRLVGEHIWEVLFWKLYPKAFTQQVKWLQYLLELTMAKCTYVYHELCDTSVCHHHRNLRIGLGLVKSDVSIQSLYYKAVLCLLLQFSSVHEEFVVACKTKRLPIWQDDFIKIIWCLFFISYVLTWIANTIQNCLWSTWPRWFDV